MRNKRNLPLTERIKKIEDWIIAQKVLIKAKDCEGSESVPFGLKETVQGIIAGLDLGFIHPEGQHAYFQIRIEKNEVNMEEKRQEKIKSARKLIEEMISDKNAISKFSFWRDEQDKAGEVLCILNFILTLIDEADINEPDVDEVKKG